MKNHVITPDLLDSKYSGDYDYFALEEDAQQNILRDAIDDKFNWEILMNEVVTVAQNHPEGESYTAEDAEELASILVFEWFDEHLEGFRMEFELPIVRKYESEAMSKARGKVQS